MSVWWWGNKENDRGWFEARGYQFLSTQYFPPPCHSSSGECCARWCWHHRPPQLFSSSCSSLLLVSLSWHFPLPPFLPIPNHYFYHYISITALTTLSILSPLPLSPPSLHLPSHPRHAPFHTLTHQLLPSPTAATATIAPTDGQCPDLVSLLGVLDGFCDRHGHFDQPYSYALPRRVEHASLARARGRWRPGVCLLFACEGVIV